MTEEMLSLTQATKYLKISRQGVHAALRQKRLQGQKISNRWYMTKQQLDEYKTNRYSRKLSRHNGKLLFNNQEGYFSLSQVAEMLRVPIQSLYYAARSWKFKFERKGSAYVVHMSEVVSYKEKYLDKYIRELIV